ncbi:MAG: hypothetical protein IPI95_13175 [Flavobacteriales bacterium]|nr:hypothetical protein [Flavobacteriales bacterium]
MRYLFTCLVLFMIGLTGIHAQSVVPVITSYGRLVVFQKGAFQEVDARKPQALFPSGDRLAYLTDAGDLKLFADGKVTTLQGGEPVQVGMSKYLLAWRTGPSLRIPAAGGSKILCRSVGRFTVSDSIIAFHDQMQQTLSAYWNGRAVPIADVLMTSEDVVWKSGSNTLLLYDLGHRRVLLFYRGRVSVLCNGDDPSRSETGGDMVAYMDEYDDTFRVFNKGTIMRWNRSPRPAFKWGTALSRTWTVQGRSRVFKEVVSGTSLILRRMNTGHRTVWSCSAKGTCSRCSAVGPYKRWSARCLRNGKYPGHDRMAGRERGGAAFP